jgi:N6-adenosine-specific RNA methylase IME4
MEYIFHPYAELFPMLSDEELDALAEDMLKHGQREPICLYDGMILDGRNRYIGCRRKGIEPRFTVYRGDDPLGFAISMNLMRRQLNESQRAMVAAKIATMKQGERTDIEPSAILRKVNQARAAKFLNVSTRSVQSAAAVHDTGTPELKHAVEHGSIAVSVAADLAAEPIKRQHEIIAALPRDATGKLTPATKKALAPLIKEIRAEKVAAKKAQRVGLEIKLGIAQRGLPKKKYGVILADPEWHFQIKSDAGMLCHPSNHYPTSDIEVIKARDVASISADDCVLFLWATVPMMPQALEVMQAWDFKYVSGCVWVKNRDGTGYWFRNRHELLLVGRKGNITAPAAGTQWSSVIEAPVGRHAAKPEQVLEMIEAYYPTLPKIELNRRGPARAGWDAWGNEVVPPVDGLDIPDYLRRARP